LEGRGLPLCASAGRANILTDVVESPFVLEVDMFASGRKGPHNIKETE
jgi:hypothetical protein